MREVAITGIGSTTFGRHPDQDIQVLATQAAQAAIERAGLDRRDIGALYLGNFIAGPRLPPGVGGAVVGVVPTHAG